MQGFPFRSIHTKESLTKISSVFALWSTSRIVWAIAMLLVFIYSIELLQDTVWTPIVLFLLLFFCEIVPILAMLDYSFIQIIDFEIGSNRNQNDVEGEEIGNSGSNVDSLLLNGGSGLNDDQLIWGNSDVDSLLLNRGSGLSDDQLIGGNSDVDSLLLNRGSGLNGDQFIGGNANSERLRYLLLEDDEV